MSDASAPVVRESSACFHVKLFFRVLLAVAITIGGAVAVAFMWHKTMQLASQADAFKKNYTVNYGEGKNKVPMLNMAEIDKDKQLATIKVPKISEIKHAEFMHDFKNKKTAIIDPDQNACMIKDLNPHMTPPENMIDMIKKMSTQVYTPNYKEIRERFEMSKTPITEAELLETNSPMIAKVCGAMPTFKLTPKNSVCPKHVYAHHDTKNMHKMVVHKC